MDVTEDIKAYIKRMLELAQRIEDATKSESPHDIFVACTILISWILAMQSQETREDAIVRAINMMESGNQIFKRPSIN